MKKYQTVKFFVIILLVISLPSCSTKWAARAADKLPKETALHKTYNYEGKVIIIGAGAFIATLAIA